MAGRFAAVWNTLVALESGTVCLLRLVNPASEIRIAGGREMHLGSLQALGLYVANSVFVGDYLTTKGQAPEADYKMIEELGFTITRDPAVSN